MCPKLSGLTESFRLIADKKQWPCYDRIISTVPELSSPYATWLLVCLMRQYCRYCSIAALTKLIIRETDPFSVLEQHAGMEGYVPGHTDIEFVVHSNHIVFRDRLTGERYHVKGERPGRIHLGELCERLDRSTSLEFPERRLRELHRSNGSLLASCIELNRQFGNFPIDADVSKGSATIYFHADAQPIIAAWQLVELVLDDKEVQFHLTALFDDWGYAPDPSDKRFKTPELLAMAAKSRADRISRSQELLSRNDATACALYALDEADAPQLADAIEHTLRTRTKDVFDDVQAVRAALQLLVERQMEHLYPSVLELVERDRPHGFQARGNLWWSAVLALNKTAKYSDRMENELRRCPCDRLAEAAFESLCFAPHLSAELFRRAITCGAKREPEFAAAILAILDEPWSRGLLLELLQTEAPRVQDICLFVLEKSSDPDMREQAKKAIQLRYLEPFTVETLNRVDFWLLDYTISRRSEEVFCLRGLVK